MDADRELRRRATRLLANSKYRAAKAGIEHTLTREWVVAQLAKNKCALSGLPFAYEPHPFRKRHGFSPSLDRINPARGYTPDNCQLVVTAANVAKAELSTQEFLLLAMAMLRKHGLN